MRLVTVHPYGLNKINELKECHQRFGTKFDPQLFRIITFIVYFLDIFCTALSYSKKTTYVELYLYINIIP